MSFNILYIENNDKDWRAVDSAVSQFNERRNGEKLQIVRARTPDELDEKLDLRFDVVLADIYYDDSRTDAEDIDDRLEEVIRRVNSWRRRQPGERVLPIIAYTGMGANALKGALGLKEHLYDIWDKNSTLPEYIAWRLSKLAVEVVRSRPDAKMQMLLTEMTRGASWDDHVKDMVKRYDAGWTERDQVLRAGEAIGNIAYKLGVWEQCQPLWGVMTDWEWMGRAASRQIRGHARHVINVFWLGYYLLHHPALEAIFKKIWQGVIAERDKMNPIKDMKAPEALSNAWFYAGLFHDVAGCVEKASLVFERQKEIMGPFLQDAPELENPWPHVVKSFGPSLSLVIEDFDEPLRTCIAGMAEKAIGGGKIDHGLIASNFLRKAVRESVQACFAREASRAIALHNLFPALPDEIAKSVSWEQEPIACLLLLCDQLQTWDRERNDDAISDENRPQRAELADIEVSGGKPPEIRLRIDYIPPAHVLRSIELYDQVRRELEEVIKARPHKALSKIQKPWPFELVVECSLGGRRLGTAIQI